MIWQSKQWRAREEIAKTGFLTALVSYISFWFVDLMQPGFVSRYFSVHIFLLAMVVFGLWWAQEIEEYEEKPLIQAVIAGLSGIAVAVLIWGASEGLDEYRAALVVIGFITPWFILKALKS